MGWFTHWFGTRYYASLYGHRDEHEARAWVATILGRWGLPVGSRVLDMGCGRGRHTRWFAEAGMRVTGIDLSPACIGHAMEAVPAAEFLVHDMREPLGDERFDAGCCLFTSLGYSDSAEDDLRALRATWRSLVPGGRFVLDFMNAPLATRDMLREEVRRPVDGGPVFHITRTVEGGAVVKRIRVEDGAEVHHFEERVRAMPPAELEALATEAGFLIEDRTDGPEALPFDPERSRHFVLWTRKPEA